MKPFSENLRYDLPLTADSVVMDCGSYEGNFANLVHQKFGCRVEAFEPVTEFYGKIVNRFSGNPKIRVWPFGLGDSCRQEFIGVKGDQSGVFCTSPNYRQPIEIRDVVHMIQNVLQIPVVSLLKLNCEGMEYQILQRLLDTDMIEYIDNLSVQFHALHNDSEARMNALIEAIGESHELTYHTPFIWTGFKLRT
jgi:FkbM family methyltransferase